MCTALYSTLGTVVTWQPSTIDYLCLWLVHATMKTAMPALQHMPSAAEVALLLPHITTPVYTNSLTWVENQCSWHVWPSFKKGPLDSGYQGWPPETIGHQLQVTVPGFTFINYSDCTSTVSQCQLNSFWHAISHAGYPSEQPSWHIIHVAGLRSMVL